MLRLTFSAPELDLSGHLDEWFGFFFGAPGDHRLRRTYTVRTHRPDHAEIDVDFALHHHGVAMDWLTRARPGDELPTFTTTGGTVDQSAARLLDRPANRGNNQPAWLLDWVLAGDLAALPALGRIVEGLPGGARVLVIAETPDPADRQEWESEADVEVRWLHGSGGEVGPSRLAEAVLAEAECGFVWMAGETREVRRVRRELRHQRALPGERYGLTGYWLVDAEAWTARYESHAEQLQSLWARGEAAGRDPEELEDDYIAALERAGL